MPSSLGGKTLLHWACAAALAAAVPALQAASFPCEKAATRVEQAICGSPEVSTLDEYLGRYYAGARQGLRHADDCLVSDQRAWIRSVRDACKDAACLKGVYLERLAVLHAVQPGVTRLRSLELPRLSSLVWIVPPALDQVAAPRSVPTRALAVSGRILDEVTTGDGYVLQSESGTRHTLVSLMFLDPPTGDALAQLARQADARYEVRGRTEPAAGAARPFAASQCTFVYRRAP